MRPWLFLPIILPASWAALTYFDLWPARIADIASNPLIALGSVGVGIGVAWIFDLVLRAGMTDRLPTERELARRGDPKPEPLIKNEFVDSAPSEPLTHLRVAMPEDLTDPPAAR